MTQGQAAALVEEHQAHFILAHTGQPGRDVHHDPDAVWQTTTGAAWSNGGTLLRFTDRTVKHRLEEIVARFLKLKLPAGFWVSPFSTPTDVGQHLGRLGFKCRKHFPGMHCDLTRLATVTGPKGVTFDRVNDHRVFLEQPHPYIGPVTTTRRRQMLDSQAYIYEKWPDRAFSIIAVDKGTIVASTLLFLDDECAGIWDVGVFEEQRNRGIGAAITAHACSIARDQGHHDCVLIAAEMGYSVYRKVGFEEVCKMSYWYSRLGRTD